MADIEIKNKYRLPYTAIEIEKLLDKVNSISVEEIKETSSKVRSLSYSTEAISDEVESLSGKTKETSNRVELLSEEIQNIKNKVNSLSYETWTFTLEDGSTVTKAVHVK